jgi:hypothetical protein
MMAHPKSCTAAANRDALSGSRIRGSVANVRTALPAALAAGATTLPGRS